MYNYQMPVNHELWRVEWQPGVFSQKPVLKKALVVKEDEQCLSLSSSFTTHSWPID
jgi:hypothetical protein